MSSTKGPRAFHRRAGRAALRGMKPFALPFPNRLHLRIRRAVEELELSQRMEQIEAQLRSATPNIVPLCAGLDALGLQLRSVQLGLDALRLDQVTADRGAAEVKRLTNELAGLRGVTEKLDKQVVALRDMAEQMRAGVAEVAGIVGARTETMLSRVAILLGEEVLMRTPEGYLLLPAEDVALLAIAYDSAGGWSRGRWP